MRRIAVVFWGVLALLSALWLAADPLVLRPVGFFVLGRSMVQYGGILAIACMSVAMALALRPRWPERWLGGLDRMYRLHKWLGIGALVLAVSHWLWTQAPAWLVGLGWLDGPRSGPLHVLPNAAVPFLAPLQRPARSVGEWAFYAAVLLIAVALIQLIPYRLFYKVHRLLAVAYLVLAFHGAVLMEVGYWASPLGMMMTVLLVYGTAAAIVVLFRRVGAHRRVDGTIISLQYHQSLRVLEGKVDVLRGAVLHGPVQ
jgi:predicted ferric reductase